MAKRINTMMIRIALISVIVLFLIFLCLSPFLLDSDKGSIPKEFEPSFAPAEYAYPEYFTDQALSGGSSWKINNSNTMVITKDGIKYQILEDGTIYKEAEDGSLSIVEDNSLKNEIYKLANEAIETSDTASDYFKDSDFNVPLNDKEVKELTDGKIDGDTFRILQDKGLSPDTIKSLLDAGFTPDEIDSLIKNEDDADILDVLTELGVTPKELKELLDTGHTLEDINEAIEEISPDVFKELVEEGATPSQILSLIEDGYTPNEIKGLLQDGKNLDNEIVINDALEDSIIGTGISLNDLKDAIADAGLTPDEYLRGLETINTGNPKTESTSSNTKIKASELPAITVSLGGSPNSATEKEEKYKELNSETSVNPSDLATAIASANTTKTDYEVQNNQAAKNDFMNSFSSNSGYSQLTKNDIAAGTVITMILKTGLNSDLPGMIVAEVTQNVFDSLTGTTLLIPKGTRLLASYDSSVSWGQKRALIAWTQLIRPDGFVMKLPGLPGIDAQGYSGVMDKVNNHTWELISSAFLASLLDLGVDEIKIQTDGEGPLGDAANSFIGNLETAGQEYLKKQMNLQPTLTIRPGRTIKLLVTDTLTLTPYKL